jgi:branched-chain amino acid aminotransferase
VGNLFARIGGEWITPPVSDGILPGIARGKILSHMDVKQASLSETDLRSADAAFISNSLGSVDIVELDGVQLHPCLKELPVGALYDVE